MKIVDPGHYYDLTNNTLAFIKRKNGELINAGTTNEEVLEVLIDRTEYLNSLFPCVENSDALFHMKAALQRFNDRTALRVAQGVETKDIPHVS